jgi:hypothetical protein
MTNHRQEKNARKLGKLNGICILKFESGRFHKLFFGRYMPLDAQALCLEVQVSRYKQSAYNGCGIT